MQITLNMSYAHQKQDIENLQGSLAATLAEFKSKEKTKTSETAVVRHDDDIAQNIEAKNDVINIREEKKGHNTNGSSSLASSKTRL